MQVEAYFEVIFFCLAIETLLFVKMKFGMYKLLHQRTFSFVLGLSIISIVLDYLTMIANGSESIIGSTFNRILNTFYLLVMAHLAFFWFRYSGYVLKLPFWNDQKKLALYAMPMLATMVLIVLSLWNGWMFYVDDFNICHRNVLYYTTFLPVCAIYMGICMVVAFYKAMQKRYYADRGIYGAVVSFNLLSLLSIPMQVYFDDKLPILSAGMMLASVLAFVLAQAQLISMDPLTRLNNRNQLNRYLTMKMFGKQSASKRLFLFVIDLDRFKAINDTYGHHEGDRALVLAADVLKDVCGPRGCFIARFGGDEFNVVAELDDDASAKELCAAIKEALRKSASALPYTLTLSIGYADHLPGTETLPDFFARADEVLYEQKKLRP